MRLFISLLTLISLFGCKENVWLDIMNKDIYAKYVFSLPNGKYKKSKLMTNDVGGIGYLYIYMYENGSMLYVSNDTSICPIYDDEKETPVVGRPVLGDCFPEDYIKDMSGYQDDIGAYRNWESLDVCIGYKGVPKDQIEEFDKAIESIRAVNVYIGVHEKFRLFKKPSKTIVVTPKTEYKFL